MKKLSILTSLAVLASSTACTVKEQEVVLPVFPQYEEFYATIEQPSETTDTKTYADDQFRVLWHADDRITIFNKYTYNQQYAFQGETGDNAGGFSKVGDDDFVTGNDLPDIYAVYPYQQSTRISNDGVITVSLPAEQTWADGSFGPGSNTMVSATSDNKLKFRNTGSILAFKLYGNNVQVSKITLQGNDGERIAGKASVTMPVGGTPSVAMQSDATQSITLSCATPVTIGTSAGSYTEFWFVVPPTDFTRGFTITITSADGGTFEKATDKSVSLARNRIYRMAPIEVVPQKPAAVPEYVDLGLSAKWATFNLGATKPEEYGDYFAWGETQPKADYSWSTYKWCKSGTSLQTKYCPSNNSNAWGESGSPDNKTVLDPEDDAAHENWGGSWRMPTDAEWTELRENCTWTWTTQNGVSGRQVTSNTNSNSIFLPAAGYPMYPNRAGLQGCYWSSSLASTIPMEAYAVSFYNDNVRRVYGHRYDGLSVRPVYSEFIPVTSISLDKTSLELNSVDKEQLTVTIIPSNATAKDVLWVSSDESVAKVDQGGLVIAVDPGTATVTAYASSGVSVSCMVTVQMKNAEPECVDLGLSVKWATFNVGATKPEEHGEYFAWGEVEPKWNYDWSTYKWCNGSGYNQTKYNTTDNKTILDLEDDSAHAIWGGSWRMPTYTEWDELVNRCTWTWITLNGVNGRLVTGPNGNSIFLPAAGCKNGPYLNGAGDSGIYWSSSLIVGSPFNAWLANFVSAGVQIRYHNRNYGLSIRPVYGEIVPVSSISIPETTTLPVGMSETLTATVLPENATYRNLTWTSSDESVATVDAAGKVTAVATGKATITAYSADASKTATCEVTVVEMAKPEAVDLGLPSGLKWASMNLGATKPEEYGDYFAWGETQPKTNYSWSTYKWCNGSSNTQAKYNTSSSYGTVDNKTVLDPEDDAAHVNWGGSWRMPTDEEWTELRTKCTWTWTTQNGVNGRFVTGPNGKSIFLPAAGRRNDTGLNDAGTYGWYRSSSLYTDRPYRARFVYFDSGNVYWSLYDRYYGFSVRPVYGEIVPVSSISIPETTTLPVGKSEILTATVLPADATYKTVTWSSSDESVATVDATGKVTAVATGKATITAYSADASKTASCEVTVKETVTNPNGRDYVDLGLPSGLKWATMNVGATKPEEYGEYFAWGETQPKSNYTWSTYKWCKGSQSTLTKYCFMSSLGYEGFTDNKTVPDPEDDAAHVNWGGSWRMPTDAEWTELRTKCTWTWTTQNGVKGSKLTGPNGKSIFLPAAGDRLSSDLRGAGSRGNYWSSSLHTGYPDSAWRVGFGSGSDVVGRYDSGRFVGFSVRPVTE